MMPEEQQIAISVLDFKSTQTIIGVILLEWLKKLDIARREFRRQCIRIWDMKEGIPASNTLLDISRVVRYGLDTDVLQNDRRPTPLDNPEENVVFTGPLKRDVEPETVAIKRQRGGNIPYDEERRDAGNFCFSHASARS